MATEDRGREKDSARADEDVLRDLIENIPAMVFIALPGPSNAFASRRWRDYAGLSHEETKGLGWQGAVHPEDLQRHMEKWRACSASGESFEDETRFRRAADGEYRWFLVRAVPTLDENARIVKWYGTLTDIEDRRLMEQALRQRQAHLADAQKLTHTGSWAWKPREGDRLHYCSDEMYRIFGLDAQDGLPSIGKLLERVHPGDRVRSALELQLRKDGKQDSAERDYRLVMPNGTVKYIHSIRHSVLDSSGTVCEILGTAVDVTERTQAEEALRRSEAYLAEAQSLTQTGSAALSEERGAWVVRYWSDENMRIWGFDPADGLPTTDLVRERTHPEDRERVLESSTMARRAKTDQVIDFRIKLPDGRVRYIHSTIHSVFRASEGYMEVVSTHVDMTERKRAEEERERLRLRSLAREFELSLEARVAERTRIARELHDTLLQSFQGLIFRLQAVRELLPKRPAAAAESLDAALQMSDLAIGEGREAVQGLRSSTQELPNDIVAAIATLGEALGADPASSHVASHRVDVEGAVRPLHPMVRDEVYRIAGEAMRNAFQHSQGTHIGVKLRYGKRQFCLRIRDNGKGVDSSVLAEWGREGHYGLRGMRERADLIGGKLKVRSEPVAGTEVELTIAASHAYAKTAPLDDNRSTR